MDRALRFFGIGHASPPFRERKTKANRVRELGQRE
jgi:hypothetical protein